MESGMLTIEISRQSNPPVTLSDISKAVKLVQLETSESSLLSIVQDIKLFDDKFYVVDMAGKILVFDTQGSFLYILGRQGNGPGEYTYISSMTIDSTSSLIYVASGRKLLAYSVDNKFVAEEVLPVFLDYLDVFDRKLWAIAQLNGVRTEEGYVNQTTLLEINPSLEVADSVSLRRVVLENQTAANYPYKYFISDIVNDRYLYTPVLTNEKILRDTLYQLVDKVLIPYAKFNFEKPHLNEKGDKTIWIKNMVNSASYIVCEYDSEEDNMLFLYSKANSKGYNMKGGFLDDHGDLVFLRPLDPANDIFYYVQAAAYSDSATEELNPTIGIVALK